MSKLASYLSRILKTVEFTYLIVFIDEAAINTESIMSPVRYEEKIRELDTALAQIQLALLLQFILIILNIEIVEPNANRDYFKSLRMIFENR